MQWSGRWREDGASAVSRRASDDRLFSSQRSAVDFFFDGRFLYVVVLAEQVVLKDVFSRG